jgi:hypothetical protein
VLIPPGFVDNPYSPPQSSSPAHAASFGWKRVLSWAAMIYLVEVVIGFLSGFGLDVWMWFGFTIEEAIQNSRSFRRIAIPIAQVYLYCSFAAGVGSKRLWGVLGVFVSAAIIDLLVQYFLFGVAMHELVDAEYLGRGFLVAMIGLVIASLPYRTRARFRSPREGDN